MKAVSLVLLLACGWAEAQILMRGSGSRAGIHFRYETRLQPELPGQQITGLGAGGIVAGAAFHRYMLDEAAKRYFGYDLSVEPEGEGAFRVDFRPLSLTLEKLELDAGWTQIPTPALPPPKIVRARDLIAVDLLVHPRTGQRIVDYLSFGDDRQWGKIPSGPARDYTVRDVPLTLSKPRVLVNGEQVRELDSSISGSRVIVYLPGYGRFAFSLAPGGRAGFRKGGEVRDTRALIDAPGATIVFECDAPVAPGGGVFNLYVHHDPSWRPHGHDGFFLGADDL